MLLAHINYKNPYAFIQLAFPTALSGFRIEVPEPYPRTNGGQNIRSARGSACSNRYIYFKLDADIKKLMYQHVIAVELLFLFGGTSFRLA